MVGDELPRTACLITYGVHPVTQAQHETDAAATAPRPATEDAEADEDYTDEAFRSDASSAGSSVTSAWLEARADGILPRRRPRRR